MNLELSKAHLYEIYDAISHEIDLHFKTGDVDHNEKKYGTLTLLNEAQCEIGKHMNVNPIECPWYSERLNTIKAIRKNQGLPEEATEGERRVWASTVGDY